MVTFTGKRRQSDLPSGFKAEELLDQREQSALYADLFLRRLECRGKGLHGFRFLGFPDRGRKMWRFWGPLKDS